MFFKNLKEKCEYYRSLTDYRLVPNSYVLVMVDGHKFSSLIKNKFEKPFDSKFVEMMNETAKYLCENIQGAKFAYTQSDEISLLITDFETPTTDSFFSYRLCKMQSLIAAMATAKFNQIYALYNAKKQNEKISKLKANDDMAFVDVASALTLCTFDCKVWTVPNANDAYAWFLYRQTDCIRNSKQQTAQTYLPHKSLVGLDSDAQIAKTLEEKGVDWNLINSGCKYGRLIYKVETEMEKDLPTGEHIQFVRNVWTPVPATDFKVDNELVKSLIPE